MPSVIHIIDRTTHLDMLMQVQLLAKPNENVVSMGVADNAAAVGLSPQIMHEPMSCARLGGYWLTRHERLEAQVFHAWSLRAASAAQGAAVACGGANVVVSVPYIANIQELDMLARLSCQGCNVTVPTRSWARKLLTRGALASCVHVLPPCAQEPQDKPSRRARFRKHLGINEHHHLLVMLGQIDHDAGFRLGPWVQAVLHQIRDDVRLVMAGSGNAQQVVRRFIHTSGYPDEALMTDWRFGCEDVLSAGDIMLHLPVGPAATWGLVAAMAAGVATVCSQSSETVEIAGDTAAFVRPDDPRRATAAVLALLDEPARATALGKAAAQRAGSMLNCQNVRAQLDAIYLAPHHSGIVPHTVNSRGPYEH